MWYFSAISCLWKFWSPKQKRKFLGTARTHDISWRMTCANPRNGICGTVTLDGGNHQYLQFSANYKKVQTKTTSLIVRPSLDLSPPLLLSTRSLHHLGILNLDACKSNIDMELAQSHSLSEKRSQLCHIGLWSLKLWGLQIQMIEWPTFIVFRCLWCIVMYCDWVWIQKSIMRSAFRFLIPCTWIFGGKELDLPPCFLSLRRTYQQKSNKNKCGNMKSITNHRSQIRPQPDQESRTFPFRLWNDVLSSGVFMQQNSHHLHRYWVRECKLCQGKAQHFILRTFKRFAWLLSEALEDQT